METFVYMLIQIERASEAFLDIVNKQTENFTGQVKKEKNKTS